MALVAPHAQKLSLKAVMLGPARGAVKAVWCKRDCLRELRWFYDRRDPAEVRRDIVA
jgi:hypothetical protein